MSPHHSDQMSQRSQVSRVALCMSKVKVLSVSESVTRSPIELFWTANNCCHLGSQDPRDPSTLPTNRRPTLPGYPTSDTLCRESIQYSPKRVYLIKLQGIVSDTLVFIIYQTSSYSINYWSIKVFFTYVLFR